MKICIAGAGAFGTALATTLAADGCAVTLWVRDPVARDNIGDMRRSPRLPDVVLSNLIEVVSGGDALAEAEIILLAVPAQSLRGFLSTYQVSLSDRQLVACCKGIDLTTLTGPSGTIAAAIPDATPAILTGPSFAADIAAGLPTALTLACADPTVGRSLQSALSTNTLRLYRSTDMLGAELGGALKNVIAIACGVTIGAGLGDSARAALMTRGFAEMQRLGSELGADPHTMVGLAGFGDLVLTCTSDLSRNYRHGLAIGQGKPPDATKTVEGVATAHAVVKLAANLGIDMPVCTVVSQLCQTKITVDGALRDLLSRPLKEE